MRNPYVIGPYVTGRKHYGRQELLDYLLHGESHAYWVVGNRRIGKTSLLRQLELLAVAEGELVPLYWDMQGCSSYAHLGEYLIEAVCDRAERFEAFGVRSSDLPEDDVLAALAKLRRAITRAGRQLLLLCDETEVLISMARNEAELMQRLHGELTAGAGMRVVAVSTRMIYQMHDVCRSWPTSPFLAGFEMSQTLGSLEPDSARALITQAQADVPVAAAPEVAETIGMHTNNHPYLLQLLCSRLFQDDGTLRPVTDHDLIVDPLLRGFFINDFDSLTDTDRRLVWAVHDGRLMDEEALQAVADEELLALRQRLHNLEALGYLRRIYGQIAIGNQFLDNWLAAERAALSRLPAARTSDAAARTALESQQAQEVEFLRARLNSKRERIIELEARRATDLINTSPSVLAEIEATEAEIGHLRYLLATVSGE